VLRAPPTWTSANPDATCAKTPQEGIVGTAARAAIRSLLGRSSQSKEGLLSEAHRFLERALAEKDMQTGELLLRPQHASKATATLLEGCFSAGEYDKVLRIVERCVLKSPDGEPRVLVCNRMIAAALNARGHMKTGPGVFSTWAHLLGLRKDPSSPATFAALMSAACKTQTTDARRQAIKLVEDSRSARPNDRRVILKAVLKPLFQSCRSNLEMDHALSMAHQAAGLKAAHGGDQHKLASAEFVYASQMPLLDASATTEAVRAALRLDRMALAFSLAHSAASHCPTSSEPMDVLLRHCASTAQTAPMLNTLQLMLSCGHVPSKRTMTTAIRQLPGNSPGAAHEVLRAWRRWAPVHARADALLLGTLVDKQVDTPTFMQALRLALIRHKDESQARDRLLCKALEAGGRLRYALTWQDRTKIVQEIVDAFRIERNQVPTQETGVVAKEASYRSLDGRWGGDQMIASALSGMHHLEDVKQGALTAIVGSAMRFRQGPGLTPVPGQITESSLLGMCIRLRDSQGALANAHGVQLAKRVDISLCDLMSMCNVIRVRPTTKGTTASQNRIPTHSHTDWAPLNVEVRSRKVLDTVSDMLCSAIVKCGVRDVAAAVQGGNQHAIHQLRLLLRGTQDVASHDQNSPAA